MCTHLRLQIIEFCLPLGFSWETSRTKLFFDYTRQIIFGKRILPCACPRGSHKCEKDTALIAVKELRDKILAQYLRHKKQGALQCAKIEGF